MTEATADNVLEFPSTKPIRKTSSTEAIWGKAVATHGYAGIPSILIRAQGRLGLSPMQFSIVVQLLEYWHEPARRPFPSKRDLAERMGVTEKAIQLNVAALEKAGLIRREKRRTPSGDWDSNIYHLDGLVQRVQALEPDFARERTAKKAWRDARKDAELSPHRRRAKPKSPC
jgi:hypothetical protein